MPFGENENSNKRMKSIVRLKFPVLLVSEENHTEGSLRVSCLEICIISMAKAADADEALWAVVARH